MLLNTREDIILTSYEESYALLRDGISQIQRPTQIAEESLKFAEKL